MRSPSSKFETGARGKEALSIILTTGKRPKGASFSLSRKKGLAKAGLGKVVRASMLFKRLPII